MRILIITSAYWPVVGGGETHIRHLAEGMVKIGNQVTVITDRARPQSPPIEILNGVTILRTTTYLDSLTRVDKIVWKELITSVLNDFEGYLKEAGFDCIHAHNPMPAFLGSILKEAWGCPLIVTFHETLPETKPFGVGRMKFMYKRLPYDKIVAVSRFFFEQAIHYGADVNKVELIYPGIDFSRFTPINDGTRIRQSINVSDSDFLILLVGRFKPRKAQLDLVRAMKQVVVTVPNAKALLVGTVDDGSVDYLNAVRETVASLGLSDHISIKTDFSWDEMPNVFAAADLVVQPSHAEGLGIALLEGMASGRPVVGTQVSGISEIIIHGSNGLLVPPGNVGCLARAIIHILTNASLAQRLAEQGLKDVKERFSLQQSLESTWRVYQDITSIYK